MPDGWARRPLREVLHLDIERVPVVAHAEYDLAGVYSFGRGLFRRGALAGSATSYDYLHRLHTGQFVMSKLKAWEGALAVVDGEFDGFVLSPEFPTYAMRTDVFLADYAQLLTAQPTFWAAVAAQSRGMGGRKERVHPDRLLDVQVDLPPLAEQRRIVDLIAAATDYVAACRHLSAAASAVSHALLDDLCREALEAGPVVPLGDVADITIGRTPPRDEPRYWTKDLSRPFCTIADMTDVPIRPQREGVTEAAEVEGKAKRVRAGSLLLSFKLTIGRVGIAGVDVFPNEAIARIEPKTNSLDKAYVALWLSAADLQSGAGPAIKGNTLNSVSLRAIRIATPPLAEQRNIVRMIDPVDSLARAAEVTGLRAESLRQNLLTHLMSGEHEIPASYDRFLDGVA